MFFVCAISRQEIFSRAYLLTVAFLQARLLDKIWWKKLKDTTNHKTDIILNFVWMLRNILSDITIFLKNNRHVVVSIGHGFSDLRFYKEIELHHKSLTLKLLILYVWYNFEQFLDAEKIENEAAAEMKILDDDAGGASGMSVETAISAGGALVFCFFILACICVIACKK